MTMLETDGRNVLRAKAGVQDFLSRMQELLDMLNQEGVEATTALRERIAVGIENVRDQYEDMEDTAVASVETLDDLVQENPWIALAAGAVLGIAVGYAASQLIPDSGWAARVQRQSRPYVRKARRFVRDHRPF
jgi:ElaB/YqjD/DUF883 family membrane-anchored ribosome-binding protein